MVSILSEIHWIEQSRFQVERRKVEVGRFSDNQTSSIKMFLSVQQQAAKD